MYFSAGYDSVKYPAFQLRRTNLEKDFNLINYIDSHFDHLWNLAAGHIVLNIGSKGKMTTSQDIISIFPKTEAIFTSQVAPEYNDSADHS